MFSNCFMSKKCLNKTASFFTQCNWCRDSAKTLIQDSVSNDQWVGQELGTRQTNVIPLLFQNLKRNPKSEKANARTLETKHSKKIELLQIISLLLCEWLSQKPFSLVFLCIFIFNMKELNITFSGNSVSGNPNELAHGSPIYPLHKILDSTGRLYNVFSGKTPSYTLFQSCMWI